MTAVNNSQKHPQSTPQSTPNAPCKFVSICQHQSCQRHGSAEVLATFQKLRLPQVTVHGCACLGQCSTGPTVKINPDNIWYCRVTQKDVPEIMEQHLKEDKPVDRLLHPRIHPRFY